jgi:hypothetical protein
MCSGDDGWGDLFDKAADLSGLTDHRNPTVSANEHPSSISTSAHGRKRKRKLHQRKQQQDVEYRAMLAGRMDAYFQPSIWSDNSMLSACLNAASECSGWHADQNSNSEEEVWTCKRCGHPSVHHRLDVAKWMKRRCTVGKDIWPLLLLAGIRNIRCCAKMIVSLTSFESKRNCHDTQLGLSNTLVKRINILVERIARDWEDIVVHCEPYMTHLTHDEGTILREKVDALRTTIMSLRRSNEDLVNNNRATLKKNRYKQILFEHVVRIIMACDASYYRLYYMQLVGMVPTCGLDPTNNKDATFFLPHPQEYFKANIGSILDIRKKAQASWNDDFDPPALADIFKYRWWETVEIFYNSGWSRSTGCSKINPIQMRVRSPTDLGKHETPAPKLLSNWRDSCRDFMCNIFAYATLPPDTVLGLVTFLSERGIHLVLDYGAGTGYIAKLLLDTSKSVNDTSRPCFNIEAVDEIPPPKFVHRDDKRDTSMNEYHGKTPAFFHIERSTTASCILKRLKGREKDSALLLCYPPPQVSMAFGALTSFLNAGGCYLIHIGEFKGLTGDDAFETLLIREMKCIQRLPTLTWGTDASNVTLWLRNDDKKGNRWEDVASLLLPCSTCNKREARKRCRLDRTLSYCSNQCCCEGADRRSKLLTLRMINVEELQYENPLHFDNL